MKLIFKKEDDTISIQLIKGTTTVDFSYVDMIKELLTDNTIEESIFEGDITQEETDRINEMLKKVQDSIVISEPEE